MMKDLETPSVEGKETTLQEPLAAYEGAEAAYHDSDVFGQEEDHDVGGSSLFFPEWSIMIKSVHIFDFCTRRILFFPHVVFKHLQYRRFYPSLESRWLKLLSCYEPNRSAIKRYHGSSLQSS